MSKDREFIVIENKFTRHTLFCLVVLVLFSLGIYLFYLGGFRFGSIRQVVLNFLVFLLYIYTGRWLCSKWYLKNQLMLFMIYAVCISLGIAFLDFLIIKYVFNHPFAGFIELLYGSMPFFLVGLVGGVLLKLVSFSVQTRIREAQAKTEQKESEFNLLQSQLSPHFLFNVLNNLYGISIDDHQRIPPLLLKLSSLLRYSVYGAKKQLVPLRDEVEYIKNYIEFEQIRISDRLRLTTDIEQVIDPDVKIAPLVLIVFVENAFKHAKNTLTQEIDIHISLKITGNFIRFAISNSYNEEKDSDAMLNEDSGLGLQNTIKRLKLLYGADHILDQHVEAGRYHVNLQLKINQQ